MPLDRPVERAFIGNALHAPARGKLELLRGALIIVGADGLIDALYPSAESAPRPLLERFRAADTLIDLGPDRYLLPGFVDLHVHAPQWPQLGLALDLPLEDWLQTHTFPLESRYADTDYARRAYTSLVDTLLANGTTTAVYFASIHLAATQLLADICLEKSQRALIGKVAMDNPEECPDFYRDVSAAAAAADSRAFIDYVRAMSGNAAGLVLPVVTPRFIPSCTDDLLHRLGALARDTDCHIQTHCSESDWAHAHVLARCGMTDTAALDRFGLLSRRTVLAHGNFIDEADAGILLKQGSGIAHCPLSNVYFSDAVLPLRRMLERGVHVGLGTDIAGGASPSLLENARHAVISSRLLEAGVDPRQTRDSRRWADSRIDAATAFWLATAGGGIALDLPIGLFRAGYQFDAVVIDSVASGNLHLSNTADADHLVQKIVYHGTRANIAEVWVANRRVHRS